MITEKNIDQEDLLMLNTTLSKLLKRWFGKGPENCFTSFHENKLIINVNNFTTPAEGTLIENDKCQLAYEFRCGVMDVVKNQFTDTLNQSFGLKFNYFHSDWNFSDNSALLLFQNEHSNWDDDRIGTKLKTELTHQIECVGKDMHQTPAKTQVVKINPKMFAVKCDGVMVQVEKQLYAQGHIKILQQRSFEIRDAYQDQYKVFESVFGKAIENIYMIWDYRNDQSYIFFCTK
ncbi:Na-translocating system protein MpsC family protein [Alkalibacillus aidingensis]|uniref:Na-translocating system protein MpsC family protein n=1 Tax=Alkalibacillus aidingensis TaxID=2747607 RepID=UPI0016613D57|nr:Na-translocating system protein MpsC family protein [Alkalibacillus aidingensis]